jgi:hypothetical protein
VFLDVVENNSIIITQDWVMDFNNGMGIVAFGMAGHNYAIHIFNLLISVK